MVQAPGHTRIDILGVFEDKGYKQPIPTVTAFDVYLDATDLDEAEKSARQVVEFFLPIMGFAANAAYDDPMVLLVYENAPVAGRHKYRQRLVRPKRDAVLLGSRDFDFELFAKLLQRILDHQDSLRFHRALVHYNEALTHWSVGKELRSVEALYIAVENLGPVVLNLAKKTKSLDELRKEWAQILDPRKCPECKHTWVPDGSLTSAAIRKMVFLDDHALLREVRSISDGLEHGFKDFPHLHEKSRLLRNKFQTTIRQAILSLIGVDKTVSEALLAPPFDLPKRQDGADTSFDTELEGIGGKLAREGRTHPELNLIYGFPSATLFPNGDVTIEVRVDITFEALGDGVLAHNLTTGVDKAKSVVFGTPQITKGAM